MDARCTPSGIALAHLSDQISDLARNEMTSGLGAPPFPGPEQAKTRRDAKLRRFQA